MALLPPSGTIAAQPAAASSRPAVAGSTNRVTEPPQQPHVMVVEDDRDTREVVKLILEMEGLDVVEASDGLDALERLHELRILHPEDPCAVLLDIMMPRCSGEEFRARQLRDPVIADVPIIVLSAVADTPRVTNLDAFAKLSKPFDPDHLVSIVRSACGVRY